MEHILHNAEVVVHYEIMNSHVPCMSIQAAHELKTSEQLDSGPAKFFLLA